MKPTTPEDVGMKRASRLEVRVVRDNASVVGAWLSCLSGRADDAWLGPYRFFSGQYEVNSSYLLIIDCHKVLPVSNQ